MFNTSDLSLKEKYLFEGLKSYVIAQLFDRLDDFSTDGDNFYPPEDTIIRLTREEFNILSKVKKNAYN